MYSCGGLLTYSLNFTLGVVGVVGVLVADAPNFEGAKGAKFRQQPPFCLFRTKSDVHPVRTKSLSENHCTIFLDIRQNIFDPVCPIVKFQKNAS